MAKKLTKIPESLDTLSEESVFGGDVVNAIRDFASVFEENAHTFFPEYTKHGISHVYEVLETAENLITVDSWKIITPDDAAILILATLLHDCAMHITEDGFRTLVQHDSTYEPLKYSNDKPWDELWEDFLVEAKRFDQRKLISIFGDTTPVKTPNLDCPIDMKGRDRMLIGEFLRRHHHRLAHEIAIYGVPGPEDERITLKVADSEMSNMAGLVARSHGMPLRDCVDYVRTTYDGTYICDLLHSVYLMVLLRISDYLQIQSQRAPKSVLLLKDIRSPLSQLEWKTHFGIKKVSDIHEFDKEAIFVRAQPDTSEMFLRTKRLLNDIQKELDTSWAVLGEVYSRIDENETRKLGITKRRIRSNIDNIDEFAKKVNYIPVKAAFDTVGPDLLKLLIKPLYGDRPEIGIRELLQNSV
ncbi:MAG: hypothetical protein HQK92_10395, partial [Nitrospirae bacterium]|nr:hypothetical protein [Nitrospirota bacterium]